MIGPDLQWEIMRLLLIDDPLDALRFASVDRQHRRILESFRTHIASQSALSHRDPQLVEISPCAVLAANVGLGRRLAGGSSPYHWEVAAAIAVMEGFVRLLYSDNVEWVAIRDIGERSDRVRRIVSTTLSLMSPNERLRALYQWIMKNSFGAYYGSNANSDFREALKARGVRTMNLGYACNKYAKAVTKWGVRLGRPGVGLKDHPQLEEPGAEGRALQPLLLFDTKGEFPRCIRPNGSVPCGNRPCARVDSPEAEVVVRRHIDDMVRQSIDDAGTWPTGMDGLDLPRFSYFFPGSIYFAYVEPIYFQRTMMYMDLRSPRIARLVGETFEF
jgi:hypothetical protein